jgi:GAF domain-containing protein
VDGPVSAERWTKLLATIDALKKADTIAEVVDLVRASARAIAAADGITIVRRIGARVHYIAEDAVSPLWTGQDFPIEQCVSGLAMLTHETILISNITLDLRVPQHLYLPTFVRSMAMFPVGIGEPIASIGLYWKRTGRIDDETVALFESLARSMGAVLYNLDNIDHATNYCAGRRTPWGASPAMG